MSMAPAYPFTFEADPAAPQSRLTVFFRILLLIPHAIVVGLLGIVTAIITLVAWVIILVTGSYSSGMSTFVVNWLHWATRLGGYSMLLTGKYPPFTLGPDDSYPVRMSGIATESERNRLTVFFRILMVIPHAIILYFVQLAAGVVVLICWFIALFTGSIPEGMHNFLVGYNRWNLRYTAYAFLLTDQYPPFSLN